VETLRYKLSVSDNWKCGSETSSDDLRCSTRITHWTRSGYEWI